MKKYIIIALFLILPLGASASLWSFYHENGEILPSVSNRAVIAAQYGIVGYRGTVSQNNLLESILRGQKQVGFSVATDFQKTLRSGMTSSQNFFYPSNLTLKDSTTLTMAALGERVFFTIEPGGSREEIVMCTGINNTTVQVTGCTRGLGFSGTSTAAVTGNAKAHNSGSIVVMSNVHYVYEQYVDTNYKTQVINGPKTFASSTVTIGDGTTTDDKCWSIYNGDANQPKLCYDEGDSKFYIYNNGVDSYDLTSSGSGLAAGKGISITGSDILFAPAPTSTSNLGFLGNKAIVATSTSDKSITGISDGMVVSTSTDSQFFAANPTWSGVNTFNGAQTKFANPINTSSTIYSSSSASSTFLGPVVFEGNTLGATKFGGSGNDGALNVTSATTTLDASSANVLVKNYSSINISSGAALTISNPATAGTVLVLKSKGDCTIAGSINLYGMGAAVGTTSWGTPDDTSHFGTSNPGINNNFGATAAGGAQYTLKNFYITGDRGDINRRVLFVAAGSPGANGGDGGQGTGGGLGGGGSGGSSGGAYDAAGSAGGAGNMYDTTGTAGTAGGAGTGGSGGGGTGCQNPNCSAAGTYGTGGRGGGALIIECGGTLTFTGYINLNGNDGVAATSGGTGGGAGGSAGMGLILYNYIGTNTGTFFTRGGAGGAGYKASGSVGAAGGAAGTSSTNHYKILQNTVY